MRMKLVEFDAISTNGKKIGISVNPYQVCYVTSVGIEGEIAGPGGHPIKKIVGALDFGVKLVPVSCSKEEAKKRLLGGE